MRGGLREIAGRVRRRPDLIVLTLLVLVGVVLRAWLMLRWRPAFLGFSDSATYLGNSEGPSFADPLRPVGYPAFLWGARGLSSNLSFTVLVQHALGVLGALLVYVAVRRLGVRRWPALLPAAVLLLHGSSIWLEHAILTESVFAFLICAALLPAVLAVEEGRGTLARVALAATAGLLVAGGTAVRPVGAVLVPLFAAWLVWAVSAGWRHRIAAGAALAAASAGLLGANLLWAHNEIGHYAFAQNDSYFYYGRVATFADCSEFTPPEGTETLCPIKPPRERLGAAYWIFSPDSDLVRSFGPATRYHPPEETALIDSFSRAAVVGQPGDYLTAVGRDLVRLVDPDFPFNPNPAIRNNAHGISPEVYQARLPAKEGHYARRNEAYSRSVVERLYSTKGMLKRDIGALETWEGSTRITGVPWLALLLLALAGPFLVGGRERRAAVFLTAVAIALTMAPIMASSYDWRYQLTALGPLAAAAAFGVQGTAARGRRRTRQPYS